MPPGGDMSGDGSRSPADYLHSFMISHIQDMHCREITASCPFKFPHCSAANGIAGFELERKATVSGPQTVTDLRREEKMDAGEISHPSSDIRDAYLLPHDASLTGLGIC